ncbi:MAG: phosphatidylglycerophosphatase A [Candidatus Cloacimonetes bacterium]|jgi:phosphatidylglycerophosphatase A|nr:phosphatidylglycerophosphatase A [Candidatus Cloacimonadota bacterium]MBT6993620.1 phosphatidylglycerophosphatase A [Candidatus Cloacimonadota bacterium]MBT7469913.1 phosphatidylglycerophosphatase A [Candidatus Cloacimonadota bacterium]
MKKTSVYISTLFGIGYFPKAPGTAGTLFAAMVYFILPEKWIGSVYLILSILFLSLISVLFISKAEKKLGHDNGKIVIDEFFGYFVAMMFLPKSLLILTLAFILFRFFDIFKPEPVNVLQKLPKGWGVMADDIMAGIYTNICLQILLYFKYIK